MEWSILFVGPVGAGKTQLIRTISDITVLSTEVAPTDGTAALKASTTVAMDVGAVRLGEGHHIRLYGAPGQQRFRFMWDILLAQAKAVVVLVNHARPDPFAELAEQLRELRAQLGPAHKPVAVAVTHVDLAPERSLEGYHGVWRSLWPCCPPVFEVDARDPADVRILLLAMTAMLEMHARLPARYAV